MLSLVIPSRARRRPSPPALRVVVAGNGMTSHKLCEKLAEGDGAGFSDLTVIGEETVPAYDRVHLSDCFSRRGPEDLLLASAGWYRERGIRLVLGDAVDFIDAGRRVARTRGGLALPYDRLVLATGSRPFIPPVPGADSPGVFPYRTLLDLEAILRRAGECRAAAVIGGGLLGLEAARALQDRGLRVSIVENSRGLLSRQLNVRASEAVLRRVEDLGIEVLLNRTLESISVREGSLELAFAGGGSLGTDMIVMAAGVRPRDELASSCGLKLGPRGGFVVDDFLQTSAPGIYAIGECAVHRGVAYGLAAPGFRMAEHLAETLRGSRPRRFAGADQSTTLKVLGIEVHILGEHLAEGSETETLLGDSYRLLTLQGGRLVGAIAVGPWDEAERVREAALRRRRLRRGQLRRFLRGEPLWPDHGDPHPQGWPDPTLVCHCNRIAKGAICSAIRAGCDTLEAVRKSTGASAVCGGCEPLVQKLLGAPVVPSAPSRMAPAGIAALAAALLILAAPSLPVAGSVGGAWHLLESLWREGAWRQSTGYAVLAMAAAALLFPLRKRLALLRRGSPSAWRLAHAALGIAGLAVLAAHTGLRLGHGLNLVLSLSFIALNLIGALAGAALAGMEKRPSPVLAETKWFLTRGHILALLPLPLLIVFHICAAYLF